MSNSKYRVDENVESNDGNMSNSKSSVASFGRKVSKQVSKASKIKYIK